MIFSFFGESRQRLEKKIGQDFFLEIVDFLTQGLYKI